MVSSHQVFGNFFFYFTDFLFLHKTLSLSKLAVQEVAPGSCVRVWNMLFPGLRCQAVDYLRIKRECIRTLVLATVSMNGEGVDNREKLPFHSWEVFSRFNNLHAPHLFQQWLPLRPITLPVFSTARLVYLAKGTAPRKFLSGRRELQLCTGVRNSLKKYPSMLLWLNIGCWEVSWVKVSCRFVVCLRKKQFRNVCC